MAGSNDSSQDKSPGFAKTLLGHRAPLADRADAAGSVDAMDWDAVSALTTAENEIPVLPVQAVSRPSMLQQVRGPLAPQFIELRAEPMILGRADDADIRIPSSALSRKHMRIEAYADGHRVIDLDSANGVFLNEVRIHSAVLRDGDMLQLGNAVFLYHEGR